MKILLGSRPGRVPARAHWGQINLPEIGLSDLFWDMPQIRSERPIPGKLNNLSEMGLSDLIRTIPRIRSENQFPANDPQKWPPKNDPKNDPKNYVIQEDE